MAEASLADIGKKIKFINDSFVLEDARTEFTGKDADTIINATTSPNTNKFLCNAFNYTSFKSAILPAATPSTIAMLQKIYVKDGATNFAAATTLPAIPPAAEIPAVVASAAGVSPAVAASAAVPAITDAQRAVWKISSPPAGAAAAADPILNSEYNYHLLLIDTGASFGDLARPASGSTPLSAFGPSLSDKATTLLELLNNIRIAYNILDADAFANYKRAKAANSTDLSTAIGQYKLALDATTGLPTGVSDTIKNISEIRSKVLPIVDLDKLDIASTRIQMIRRLLYMYETIIHIYIATYLLENVPAANNLRIPFYDILYETIRMLDKRNNVVDDVGSGVNTILKNLQTEMSDYSNNHNSIEDENTRLKKLKTDILIEKDQLTVSESYKGKISKVFYLYLVVLIVVLAGIFMIMTNTTLSDGMKKLFVGIMASVSIVVMVALYLLNRYVITEPFAGMSTIPTPLSATAIETGYATFITDNTGQGLRNMCYLYLINTINLGLIMDSYKDYKDMNYSISKEVNYYKNKNSTLGQDKQNVTNAHRIMELEAFINRYRIQYFVQLLVTITVTALLITYLPIPGLTTFLVIVAALLILLFTYMYIINVNNMVHTDATKLYWGKPELLKSIAY